MFYITFVLNRKYNGHYIVQNLRFCFHIETNTGSLEHFYYMIVNFICTYNVFYGNAPYSIAKIFVNA